MYFQLFDKQSRKMCRSIDSGCVTIALLRLPYLAAITLFVVAMPVHATLTEIRNAPSDEISLLGSAGVLETLYGLDNLERIDDGHDNTWRVKSASGGVAAVRAIFNGFSEIFGFVSGQDLTTLELIVSSFFENEGGTAFEFPPQKSYFDMQGVFGVDDIPLGISAGAPFDFAVETFGSPGGLEPGIMGFFAHPPKMRNKDVNPSQLPVKQNRFPRDNDTRSLLRGRILSSAP